MIDFELFRVTINRKKQMNLFSLDHREILKRVVINRDENTIRKGSFWAIGNVLKIDSYGYYFRFGKTTLKQLQKFEDGSFKDEKEDIAHYTHVFIDVDAELIAIAKKTALAPSTETIASRLADYFKKNKFSLDGELDYKINPIRIVVDFIYLIQQSYAIKKFEFTFSKPNPTDQKRWMKLFENLAEESNSKGKTTLSGDDINKDTIEEIARSVNVSNNDAVLQYQIEQGSAVRQERLRTSKPICISILPEELDQKVSILEQTRECYRIARDGDDN